MNVQEKQINRYLALNELASGNGTVLFGGTEDKEIPISELQQSFSFEEKIYNRSFEDLSIYDAEEVYAACVEALNPESILLHIGNADLERFKVNSSGFDNAYRRLLTYIKRKNKKCMITVIPLKNLEESSAVTELNRHLEIIAESEQCHFCDINTQYVWNPKEIREVISFVYSTGFVRPLKRTAPNYDLIKVLFCYDYKVSKKEIEVEAEEERRIIGIQSDFCV